MEKRKVAIYARVSTEHEAQLSALENQVQYYDNIMEQHPNWELYETYIDEGITGTSVKKRKNFLKMIQDAEDGKFDLIITREVSRFARNTVDTLQETRKLKRIGVEVWFTEDNIWTMNDEDGELRLTIMATLAQNESKKTSLRVKAGQTVSFQNAVPYGNGSILGYDKLPNHGGFVINPEQAETVRMIYDLYLQGKGERAISYELEKRGRLTSTGKTHWYCSYVGRVLNNPFYCGTIVYRKEYVPDFLEQKKVRNRGDVEQIIVEGNHEPIITKEQYAEVHKIMDSKRAAGIGGDHCTGYKASKDIWCRKMVCECGHKFNRKVWHYRKDGAPQYAYQCYSSISTGTVSTRLKKGLSIEGICDVPMVQGWKLGMMANLIFKQFWNDKGTVVKIADELLEQNIQLELDNSKADQIKELEAKKHRIAIKLENLLDLRISDEITKDEYSKKKQSLEENLSELDTKINELDSDEILTEDQLDAKVEVLKFALEHNFDFDTYNIPDNIIDAFVKKIVVHKDYFEWQLNLFEGCNIFCLASGNRAHPNIQFADGLDEDKNPFFSNTQHRQLLLLSSVSSYKTTELI
jgi:DNA invertase Pin-like site-specific DNA recombinase